MAVTESAVRASFGDQITSNKDWNQFAQNATRLLNEEVRDSGAMLPVVLADWDIQQGIGMPIFELRLSDFPDDPEPVLGKFAAEDMRHEEVLRNGLRRLYRPLLPQGAG